ncbi:MAG: protein kinase [Gemmatimonadaceae bacterium]|nr:protein kinase [Gemmatimonadaceae bacterium]
MTAVYERLAFALGDRYRIERELGTGGMATVYLAHDARHDRKVAIKVLKPELAAVLGGERFVVEIKTTASLQHPHILPLFDSGTADGFLFYVMPYIQGETIREKLNRETQFGVDEALRIAREIADALDYAHRHGVIHRDIKPENILLHDGRAMVMDFGIALAVSAAAGGRMTETGLSLGTPHYMSPEQATAEKVISGRSDIYSLASVLYEMLAGQPPHIGGAAQQVIMKILTEQAAPVTRLRKSVPQNVAAALAKALEKLPADRFDSAKAFGEALVNPLFSVDQTSAGVPQARVRRGVPASAFAAVTAIAVISSAIAAWSWRRPLPAMQTPSARFTLDLPDSQAVVAFGQQTIVVSPDGSEILYGGRGRTGNVLFRRRLDEMTVSEVPGSDNLGNVTYTPDGLTLAITKASRQLIALPLPTGAPIRVADDVGRVSWGDNDVIVFSRGSSLWRTDRSGQRVTRLTIADSANGGVHTWPYVLPGGEAVLFNSIKENGSASRVQVVRVRDGAVTSLDLHGLNPRYVPSGHILVSQTDGTVLAAPFDLRTLELRGKPISVLEGLAVSNGAVLYGVSRSGVLAYLEGDVNTRPVILDRKGREQALNFASGRYQHPRLSPKGDRVVIERNENGQSDIWILTRATGQPLRLTRDGVNGSPEWSADGSRVGWLRSDSTGTSLVSQRADGSGLPEQIRVPGRAPFHFQFVPGGKYIVAVIGSAFRHDIALIPIDGSAAPRMLANSSADELMPNVSPDGRWMAYTSTETGRTEVYVVNVDNPSTRLQLTTDGGGAPAWSSDGTAVIAGVPGGGGLVSISLAFTPQLEVTHREKLFAFPYRTGNPDREYDASLATGEIVALAQASSKRERIVVVTGWLDELRRRMAQAAP